ncbi:MAG: DnaD domain protein, partial [Paraclostridium sp.]
KSKNISNPSISYINGIVKSWNEKNIKTLEDLRKSEDEFKRKSELKKADLKLNNTTNSTSKDYNKTKFHNFEETFTNYSSEELEKIIEENQRRKFK